MDGYVLLSEFDIVLFAGQHNKESMALHTSLLLALSGKCGYEGIFPPNTAVKDFGDMQTDAARGHEADRIHAIVPEPADMRLEVQVRTERVPRRPHVTDDLASAHPTRLHRE